MTAAADILSPILASPGTRGATHRATKESPALPQPGLREHLFILPVLIIVLTTFTWFVTWGGWHLFDAEPLTGYYDAQARGILHGRLDVPPGAISFEAFHREGKTYGYYGVAPALLRLPLVAFLPSMDGRWSRSFLLAACALNVLYAYRFLLLLRDSDAPLSPAQKKPFSLFVLSAGIGSTNLFMASRSYVYHEAIMWGATFSLLFAFYLVRYLRRPTLRLLGLAGALAFMAFFSRATGGAGALLAMSLVSGILLTMGLRTRGGRSNQSSQVGADILTRARGEAGILAGLSGGADIIVGIQGGADILVCRSGGADILVCRESTSGGIPAPRVDSQDFRVGSGGQECPPLPDPMADKNVRPTSAHWRPITDPRQTRMSAPPPANASISQSEAEKNVYPTFAVSQGPAAPAFGLSQFSHPLRHALVAGLMVITTIACYFAINYSKFRTFDGVPVRLYSQYLKNPERMAITGGRQIHPENLRTGLASYFGLRAVEIGPEFPWVYMTIRPPVFAGAAIDVVEPTSSVPVSMPALFLLACAGVFATIRARSPEMRRLRLPVICLLAGGCVVLVTVGITERYLHDFYPFLLVAGAAGAVQFAAMRHTGPRAILARALVPLTLVGICLNAAFAYDYQREIVWGVPAATRAQLTNVRAGIDHALGREPALPREAGAK